MIGTGLTEADEGDLPTHRPRTVDAAAITLLRDLHTNLWGSLKNTLDIDRVALGALMLTNLGGMVLTIVAANKPVPLLATIAALGTIDFFLFRIFRNSQSEGRRVIALLTDIYSDHGLGPYFDQMREEFFVERYRIRLLLCPVLFALAVVLGLAFGLAG